MKNIDFMGRRGPAAIVSIVLVVASLGIIFTKGIKKNVDFEGGSKMTVAFDKEGVGIRELRELVTEYEPSAAIVTLKTEGIISEFSIKIKNPQADDRESDISPERRQNMDQAFSALVGDDAATLELIRAMSAEDLGKKLMAEDIYAIAGTDQEKQTAYNTLAQSVKTGAADATTVRGLADAADSEKGALLARGLHQVFPALNRITPDQLNAILTKYNPLSRDSGVKYGDITKQVVSAREAQGDFFASFDFLSALAVGDGENKEALTTFIKDDFTLGDYRIVATENFSASIAAELLSKAWKAVILALFGILLYLWMRFSLAYGVASVVALTHDVIISLGVFALVGLELSNPVVAAFLTIVGYSLNDTIVVFDRVRDNLGHKGHSDVETTMNTSINQTLSRTVVTSLTTLFVVLVIYIFSGNETLENFSFPLLIGIVVGTYSSIFVASPTLLLWHNRYKSIIGS